MDNIISFNKVEPVNDDVVVIFYDLSRSISNQRRKSLYVDGMVYSVPINVHDSGRTI